MVFAERNETVSGGNFHGEYPAKVSINSGHLNAHACINISARFFISTGSRLPSHRSARIGQHQ